MSLEPLPGGAGESGLGWAAAAACAGAGEDADAWGGLEGQDATRLSRAIEAGGDAGARERGAGGGGAGECEARARLERVTARATEVAPTLCEGARGARARRSGAAGALRVG